MAVSSRTPRGDVTAPPATPVGDDGTVMLVAAWAGEGTPYGHGQVGYPAFKHPQSGLWLMRVPRGEVARHFCERAGCYEAPVELQSADR
jgi:hypothetical protein